MKNTIISRFLLKLILGSELPFLRVPKIKRLNSSIFMTVSSDAKSLDLNLTEAILRCSIYTHVSFTSKNISFVSNYISKIECNSSRTDTSDILKSS